MPSLPPHLLQHRTHSPLKPRTPSSSSSSTTFEVPTTDIKATKKQIDAYEKLIKYLPEDSKKKLKKLQKEHGLTRDQLILAALKEWAPQYVGAFKMAEFFGIVRV
ncbi:predicted protein [Sclerotinia sclerotiorum 1980 UF-70]|uniref:Uncharacterized protein n=2 Tax=Sclerotinia sclerotiorum (strain ATCC 18683 / 1980 / Ss-1) TaxID=665079 RepID=A7ECY4_SCLS1|nr:predicted protein [Sclerotinia sclerotiorum 1980 UF-70]APA11090.1 hypothetical protein sscle_07g058600 [Sclerotinia sclerotiorum 1980 UF-70]EDO00700.1 predicted protein [Sclerotinia sclerotiorum 1980 UF-70]